MRFFGLDVGSKTIGVAVSDELGLCAHSVCTLKRLGTKRDVEQIKALCQKWKVSQIIVGLPYDCEGNEGHRATRVRVLGNALEAAGFLIDYQDESFTTVAAHEVLLEADLSRKKRKQVVDKVAASFILDAWMEQNRSVVKESAQK